MIHVIQLRLAKRQTKTPAEIAIQPGPWGRLPVGGVTAHPAGAADGVTSDQDKKKHFSL
jgi:hypothetical protein